MLAPPPAIGQDKVPKHSALTPYQPPFLLYISEILDIELPADRDTVVDARTTAGT